MGLGLSYLRMETVMLEWLRIWVIKPVVELLQLIPLPWQYGAALLLVLLILYLLSPIGIVLRLILWVIFAVLQPLTWVAGAIQQLCAGRPPSSFIDAIDHGSEWALWHLGAAEQRVRKGFGLPVTWGRPKMGMILLLALLPIGAWYIRPQLGNITVARGIDTGFNEWHTLEGWALTRQWNPVIPSTPTAAPVAESAEQSALESAADEGLPTPAARPLQVGDMVRVVSTEGARLRARESPSTDAQVVTRFPEGSVLEIVEGPQTTGERTWLRVRGEQGEGWCDAAFLAPTE